MTNLLTTNLPALDPGFVQAVHAAQSHLPAYLALGLTGLHIAANVLAYLMKNGGLKCLLQSIWTGAPKTPCATEPPVAR